MISLTSGKSLDYETTQQHVLTVSASEADGSDSDTATVTINVTEIDDDDDSPIEEIPIAEEKTILGRIDISDATDTGADDTTTANGNPVITFTGPEGLTISVKGPGGDPLPSSAYSVSETTSNGVTTYTVTLLDADTSKPGRQAFGDFVDGQPTKNDNNTGDGTYLIQATDIDGFKNNVGSFDIETNAAEVIAKKTTPIDITDETDTGADDTTTANGNPVITFTGPEGLTISLKGPNGNPLPTSTYSVAETTSNGVTSYTVTLLDADLTKPGNQPFGDFDNGQPTNNDDNNGDGTYTIQSTDTAGINNDVGTFDIQPTLLKLHDLGRLISPTRLIQDQMTQSQAMAIPSSLSRDHQI